MISQLTKKIWRNYAELEWSIGQLEDVLLNCNLKIKDKFVAQRLIDQPRIVILTLPVNEDTMQMAIVIVILKQVMLNGLKPLVYSKNSIY